MNQLHPSVRSEHVQPRRHRAGERLQSGHELLQQQRFVEAREAYLSAAQLDPSCSIAYHGLASSQQMLGEVEGAVANYRKALQIDSDLSIARQSLGILLTRLRRRDEAQRLWREECTRRPQSLELLGELTSQAMRSRDLQLAGDFAFILASLRWTSPWFPTRSEAGVADRSTPSLRLFLTPSKLRHDIEQFRYLQRRGVLGNEFARIVREYEVIAERLERTKPRGPIDLTDQDRSSIGDVYNRIVHLLETARVPRALSNQWDPKEVERQYLDRPPGVVVVDNFLSADALRGVRQFCLESTVWSANRYAYGRLGAFFHDGFNCPLLLQIAEELREALPRVIGDRYPLHQLWGYKYGYEQPADAGIHADFAAINVNFWITPDDANLDPTTGGLVVYEVDAPQHWDFETYNGRSDVIRAFLERQGARQRRISYRQNRAVIFNSDLFHGTDAVRFRPEYESRRINVTMLYGLRENDVHHRELARPDVMYPEAASPAWRSAAFAQARRSSRHR